MSAGLYPLLNDIPTFRLLLERAGVGTLVDFSDAEAAADAFVAKWQEIETDYRYYQTKLIDVASTYDWPKVTQTYARMYDCICGTTSADYFGCTGSRWNSRTNYGNARRSV